MLRMRKTPLDPRIRSQHMWTGQETACEPEWNCVAQRKSVWRLIYLCRDCGEMSKSKKVDNPDAEEEADEVLANVVDADEI